MMNKEQIIKLLKNKNNLTICLIFIIGVVLMLMSGRMTTGKSEKKQSDTGVAEAVSLRTEEERLEEILSEIDGAGSVSVMITYRSGSEKDIAYETKTASKETGSEVSEETKAVISDGSPVVVRETYPRVKGVIVAAEGADNKTVKKAIYDSVAAALDVPVHRICIFKKEEE